MSRKSTAVSYAILAGTAVYCLVQIKDKPLNTPHMAFAAVIVASATGVCKWGSENPCDGVVEVHKYASYFQLMFAMPCITTAVWLANEYKKDVSWLWTVISVFPFFYYFKETDIDAAVAEFITMIDLAALSVASFLGKNYYGIASALSYALGYFSKRYGESLEIPPQVCYNCCLCCFALCALKAIQGRVKQAD
ncbi:hypothetical protein BDFB_006938 [Asbolus verrucosus]|uniref:Uncharacterized protein n=1 Tax=Asbolus verrucosus TaxID=1661398 RepID=A0A482VQB9_ASBVE|nr:hypothetical protein BDFB_006938 [Asbolus verrucosus]